MATLFGFKRLPGTARKYIAESSADYAPGTTLSRRQFDAYVRRMGARKSLPGVAQILETEDYLARLAADLERRGALAASEFEREAIAQARESAAEVAKRAASAKLRRERQAAGQRRFNSLRKAFQRLREDEGEELTAREVTQDPEFQEMRAALRNPSKHKDTLRGLFEKYGKAFREIYEDSYGREVGEVTKPSTGERFTRIVLPSGRSLLRPQRKAA